MLEGVGQGRVDNGRAGFHPLVMHAVSYAEARANLDAMIDKVVADGAPLAITRYRAEGAVLVSASEWAEIEKNLDRWCSPNVADFTRTAVPSE